MFTLTALIAVIIIGVLMWWIFGITVFLLKIIIPSVVIYFFWNLVITLVFHAHPLTFLQACGVYIIFCIVGFVLH
jgi:hypothetical protein